MPGQIDSILWTWMVVLLYSFSLAEKDGFRQPSIKEIKALSDKFLENYSKHILPSESPGPFNVTIHVGLLSLGEIDEIEEKLSTVAWFYFRWIDESIRWNKNETNIRYITMGWNTVWTPVLRVSNPHADVSKTQNMDRSYDTVIYTSDGTAFFDEMMTTQTTCNLDMTYYPFDIQSCDILFSVVGSSKFLFNLEVSMYESLFLRDAYHGSWTLLNKNVSSEGGFFKIEITFGRRPLFILLNILLPIIILALLTPMVFVLPKKSGERVGYAITMLLAISVYMTIVSDHLPKNSQPMPLISVMVFIWYMLDAIIVFVVIINTKIYNMRDTKSLSKVSRKFVILTRKLISVLTCKKSKRKVGEKNKREPDHNPSEETEKCFETESVNENEDRDDHIHSERVTCKDLSHAIDKWCFLISYTFKIAFPVIFLSFTKSHSHEK